MIYTITLSPAIDYFITTEKNIHKDLINRAHTTSFRIGGKGLNVSIILNTLNVKSTAITLLGGFSGDFIKTDMRKFEHCYLDSINVDETTRINVKLDDGTNKYSINAPGPKATQEVKDKIIRKLDTLQPNDFVMLCGSRIPGIDDDWLILLTSAIREKKAHLVLDMEQIDLKLLEEIKPYLIKPNLDELKFLMNKPHDETINIQNSLQTLLNCGVSNVLLSLGENGALFASDKDNFKITQSIMYKINDVGMGDAMLGTFIGKLTESKDILESLRYAAAAGSATAHTKDQITLTDIENELVNISIT